MPLLTLVLVVAVVAVLTAGATSVRAVSRLWLRHWIEHRSEGTAALRAYLERPARLAHAASTASAITVFVWGAILATSDGMRSWIFARDALIGLTALLVFGQLIPRAVARRYGTSLVPILVPMLRVVDLIVTPFLRVGQAVVRLMVPTRPTPRDEGQGGLEELLRDGAFDDMGATEEMAIISGVVQFGERTVGDVMTTRSQIFALDAALPPEELARRVAHSGYSRVPLYRESPDNIVGMLHVFDIFRAGAQSTPVPRPLPRTPTTRRANEQLFELLRARRQMALVVGDADQVVGLVTMEDLLEVLVGDIRDEHDE
jgi:putative hemolysin